MAYKSELILICQCCRSLSIIWLDYKTSSLLVLLRMLLTFFLYFLSLQFCFSAAAVATQRNTNIIKEEDRKDEKKNSAIIHYGKWLYARKIYRRHQIQMLHYYVIISSNALPFFWTLCSDKMFYRPYIVIIIIVVVVVVTPKATIQQVNEWTECMNESIAFRALSFSI